MFFWISKTLQPLLWPSNLALVLLSGMGLCYLFKRDRYAKYFGITAFFVLWIPSLPLVAFPMMRQLERVYPVLSTVETPPADAIVVLGGSCLGIQPPRKEVQEYAGSRLTSTARLFRAKKAKQIIVSSGSPYGLPDRSERTEAMDMRDFLVSETVPAEAILLEDRSRNTDENARYTAELLRERKIGKIILVTSAFHMPRSLAMFHKYGVHDIVPFPVDLTVTDGGAGWGFLLPETGALGMSTTAIKEYMGRFFYLFRRGT